jgi:23S rRNA (cytosine1962-C5)-methyltransferase
LLFTFCCSQHVSTDLFQKIVFGAAVDAGRKVQILKRLGHPIDHPVSLHHPEGEYLKGLLLNVLE